MGKRAGEKSSAPGGSKEGVEGEDALAGYKNTGKKRIGDGCVGGDDTLIYLTEKNV